MNIKFLQLILFISLFSSCYLNQPAKRQTDLERENLKGDVKTSKLYNDTLLLNTTEYNKKGFKTSSTFFNPDGKLRNTNVYIFDKLGNLTEEQSTFAKGEVYRTLYLYDSENRNIKKISIFPDNSIDSKLEFEYDNKNRVSKRTYISKNGDTYFYTFEYDKNLTKEIHCTYGLQYLYKIESDLIKEKSEFKSNGKKEQSYKYEYNELRDLITEIILWEDKETDKETITYIYDKINNWTQKTTEYKSGSKSKLIRLVEY